MKKVILLTLLIGVTAVRAANFNISVQDARNFRNAVQNINPQLLNRIQNHNGAFIPLSDARELITAINSVISNDNSYNQVRNLFAGYGNINRRNIGSFTQLWQQIVAQANQPLVMSQLAPRITIRPAPRAMIQSSRSQENINQIQIQGAPLGPSPAVSIIPPANPQAVPQIVPVVSRYISPAVSPAPSSRNIALHDTHSLTEGESQPQISPTLERMIDDFLDNMNHSSTPPEGTSILPSVSNFFKVVAEEDLDPDMAIATFKRIHFDNNTANLIDRFSLKLNGNDKKWAIIANRFFAIRKAFSGITGDDPYKLAFLDFVPPIAGNTPALKAVYGNRGGEAVAQLSGIYNNDILTVFNVLHGINKDEAVSLVRLFKGDVRILLYFGNALMFDHVANRIVFPELLQALFIDDAEFYNIVENNYVIRNIEVSDLFPKLLGDAQFNEWNINFSNEYCGSVFIQALGVLFHSNKDYYRNSIENVHRDLIFNDASITWNGLLLAAVTDLSTKDELDTETKKRRYFIKMLTGSFSKMFSTNDFHNLYPYESLPFEEESAGGIANIGHFNRNTMIFLFGALGNLLSDEANTEEIAEIIGQLIQGFWHCPAGQSNAVRLVVKYMMSDIEIPENISLLDMLKVSISISCQDKMGHIFHFMTWEKENKTHYVSENSYDNIFAVNRNDLVEYHEGTMCLKHVYRLLDGAYGLPKEENDDYSIGGREAFHMLQLHLLNQFGNPYVETALLAVYESEDHPEIRKYGADMLEDKYGERFYEWGRIMYRDGNTIQELPAGSSDISYANMNTIMQTMLYAVMNDTRTVMCDIIENGVFWSKLLHLFDKNHNELPDFQMLLNVCSEEEAESLSLRFLTYVFQHTENPTTVSLLSNEKQKPDENGYGWHVFGALFRNLH